MSVKVMSLVWDNFKTGGSEKLAMLAMADWCNDDGGSLHPSIKSISKKIGMSEKQTRRVIHGLIEQGYISVIGNNFGGDPGQSRIYRLNVEKIATPPTEGRGKNHSEITEPLPPVSPLPCMGPLPPVSLDPSRGCPSTPPAGGSLTTSEPSVNHHIKSFVLTSEKKGASTSSPPKKIMATRLDEKWVLPETWKEWAIKNRSDLTASDIQREADCFADYWHSKAGADARKVDWGATWRNWIRRCQPRSSSGHRSASGNRRVPAPDNFNGIDYGVGGKI